MYLNKNNVLLKVKLTLYIILAEVACVYRPKNVSLGFAVRVIPVTNTHMDRPTHIQSSYICISIILTLLAGFS